MFRELAEPFVHIGSTVLHFRRYYLIVSSYLDCQSSTDKQVFSHSLQKLDRSSSLYCLLSVGSRKAILRVV